MRGTTLCNHSCLLFPRPLLQPQVVQQQHGLSSFGERISFFDHIFSIGFKSGLYILKMVIHCIRFQYLKEAVDIHHKYSYNSKCLNYNYTI